MNARCMRHELPCTLASYGYRRRGRKPRHLSCKQVHAGSSPAAGLLDDSWPLECDGFARDPPKVADQVRLLARALPASVADGTAAFEAARPGSTPGRGIVLEH